jgi:aerobic carbon-monoxide dehydrogenase small subunit
VTPIALTVNGRKIEALVEPRTHLGDFLREQCRLTGTHLGCEHGVCGACTVSIDGAPMRSCITYAVQCDGRAVQTVEGFDGDPIMQELRAAFSREHALQCGFCTPGMLIAARDIVQRLPDADERRIRVELSGNLCRCTGYLGIVHAVASVLKARASAQPATATAATTAPAAPLAAFVPTSGGPEAPRATAPAATEGPRVGWTRFEESFVIAQPPASVWALFADIPAVTACLPGAALTEHDAHSAKGKMTVKLGPIHAGFAGSAAIERNEADMSGVIRGAGNDRGSGSRTKGEIAYRLTAEDGGRQTRVSLIVEYNLQGALAQFSRSSLAQELGHRLVGEFAANLNARLGGAPAVKASGTPLNVGQLVWAWFRERLHRMLAS